MTSLKMNPSQDAGRFAYHLKFLLKADLLEVDSEAKKYYLTDLGKMVLDVADRVEKKAVKPRGMLVRTSHFTLEEFDANKIANSLIKEAKMPAEIAQKAAKEAEKRLMKSKTKYVTAPLDQRSRERHFSGEGTGGVPPQTHAAGHASPRSNRPARRKRKRSRFSRHAFTKREQQSSENTHS